MLDYEIWGLRASGFIFSNLLLHTANGLLFFLLLRRLAGDKVWIFPAALIFLLHPVQVESAVWVTERKNLLAMFFYLSSFSAYLSYRYKGWGEGKKEYFFCFVLFVCALLTKPIAVILPLMLVLYDFCYLEKGKHCQWQADKIPFILAAAIMAWVTMQSQLPVSMQEIGAGRTSYHGGGPFATFLTMLPVLVSYLRMIVWPADLSTFYDPPIKTAVDFQVAGAALVCVALLLVGIALYRRRRDIFFWYALFFVGLIPVSQIVPIVTLMNDRYLYFPLLGGAAFIAFAVFRDVTWAEAMNTRRYTAILAIPLLVIGAYATVTFQRVGTWQNSYTLWKDAVQKAPMVALTHDGFGEGLLEHGKIDEAIAQFRIAISLESDDAGKGHNAGWRKASAVSRNNLGTAYGMKGMTDDAIEQFSIALQLNPEFDKAYFNMGNALMHKGSVDQALQCFAAAVRLNPGNPAFQANFRRTQDIIKARGFERPVESGN
jgi:hypothetical protein